MAREVRTRFPNLIMRIRLAYKSICGLSAFKDKLSHTACRVQWHVILREFMSNHRNVRIRGISEFEDYQ